MEELSPLCVRIRNAFTKDDIATIHSAYRSGLELVVDVQPHAKLYCSFGCNYVGCTSLGSFTIHQQDDEKAGANSKELVRIKIDDSPYSVKHGISNIACTIPIDRLSRKDLQRNHKRVLCKTALYMYSCLHNSTMCRVYHRRSAVLVCCTAKTLSTRTKA